VKTITSLKEYFEVLRSSPDFDGRSQRRIAVLGKTVWLSYEPVDMTEELPANATRDENRAV
jgi:hypothetical protein